MTDLGWTFDLGRAAFLAATCVTSARYGLRQMAGDWSFLRSGVTVPGAIEQIRTPETGVFSVYRFIDDFGRVRVVRTPGTDVLPPKPRVQLCYVPTDDSRAIERRRLTRKIVGAAVGLGVGTLAAAAEVVALLTSAWWH